MSLLALERIWEGVPGEEERSGLVRDCMESTMRRSIWERCFCRWEMTADVELVSRSLMESGRDLEERRLRRLETW